MEGYAINKTLLTSSDLQALLTGLQGQHSKYQQVSTAYGETVSRTDGVSIERAQYHG